MTHELPEEVAEKVNGADKLSAKKLRQFQHIFNSCYEKHGDDVLCHKMAWGGVKSGKTSCDEVAEAIDWDSMVEGMNAGNNPDGIEAELRAVRKELEGTS